MAKALLILLGDTQEEILCCMKKEEGRRLWRNRACVQYLGEKTNRTNCNPRNTLTSQPALKINGKIHDGCVYAVE